MLEKILESPLDCKEIKTINSKENQSWIFIVRMDTENEVEAPILWPPDVKSQLITKDPDSGKDWMQKEKWMTEDEMAGWHHWRDGHEFQQAPRNSEGQGSLTYCSPRGWKEWDMTEWLNNNKWSSRNACWTLVALLYMKGPTATKEGQQWPQEVSSWHGIFQNRRLRIC